MKKLFVKICIAASSIAAFLGITAANAPANIQYDNSTDPSKGLILNEIQEQTPFYLYHADQIVVDGNEMIAWHTSHSSHSSHYSHSSHESHYSHYSSRY